MRPTPRATRKKVKELTEARQGSEALRSYPIDGPVSVSPDHLGGRTNRSYLVTGGSARYVLRRSSLHRTRASVGFEHRVLQHLADHRYPAPAPIRSHAGDTLVVEGGRLWTLSPYVEGDKLLVGHLPHLVAAANALAVYHRLMRDYPTGAQRDGFEDTERWLARTAAASKSSPALEDPALEEAQRFVTARLPGLARSLTSLPLLPRIVIHGDWRRSNILFRGDHVTGVLDFDAGHSEVRGADLATAICTLCRYDDKIGISLRRAEAFLAAYQAEEPISEAELRAIPALIRARRLRSVKKREQRIRRGFTESGESPKQRRFEKLSRAMARVRWLENHNDELLDTIMTAGLPKDGPT